ncbi:hypothetical protein [Streptomyces sp. NPDC089919]|uniref:hypothetical protein n=1 Tax=Streptomyces sp. NPDC089919 TaxID=3155188 RepID=UPI003446B443
MATDIEARDDRRANAGTVAPVSTVIHVTGELDCEHADALEAILAAPHPVGPTAGSGHHEP